MPQVTPRARTARSRSARELSLGDSVLREAKLVSEVFFDTEKHPPTVDGVVVGRVLRCLGNVAAWLFFRLNQVHGTLLLLPCFGQGASYDQE